MSLRLNASAVAAATASAPRVIPAQVNFLTIYNPTLGDTEETEKDQIMFWAGKDELGINRPGRRPSKDAETDVEIHDTNGNKTEEHILNERLRQIGLARGMVEFARNFSTDQTLDTVETDRSRIVLYELEKDWWILASIDLTRLPPSASATKNSDDTSKEPKPQHEYSSREVSPANLLRSQLIRGHNLFLMHHASNLWELYNRLGRQYFCSLLNRFWEAFARKWDVLLHGNPAVDVYGDCVKLAGGGELGVGVGEEEWGSGEREVLEGFVERADGLVECIVGRYGAAPPEKSKKRLDAEKQKRLSVEERHKVEQQTQEQPWLGSGDDPGPADGVIFSGVGTISRKSLATVSQWMEAIFKHGDSAYGIGENPASRPRQKRKRPKVTRKVSAESTKGAKAEKQATDAQTRLRSPKSKPPDLRRQAIENNAAPPGIPAPLVSAVERSLDDALAQAAQRSGSKSPKSSPKKEKTEHEAMNGASPEKDESSRVFSMGGMKNMLTFGYGSSWTLNPNGFEKKDEQKNIKPVKSKQKRQTSDSNSHSDSQSLTVQSETSSYRSRSGGSRPAEERLQELDPTPEVSDEDVPFVQKLEQSIGKFLIGLSGDLENAELEDSDDQSKVSTDKQTSAPQRIFLRTLTVELANAYYQRPGLRKIDRKPSQASDLSRKSAGSSGSAKSQRGPEPKTSAAASVDGPTPANKRYEKVQVAVYVHQPFIFVFIFELHTAKLTMPGFYRSIHHQLGPLQKPLLQRTDPTRVTERIAMTLSEKASSAISAVKSQIDNHGNAIYDLVYDPTKNTIRTSIPNIPVPTSPDSAVRVSSTVSGAWYTLGIPIGTSNSPASARLDLNGGRNKVEPWTRVEALNVHTQILNTFIATRNPRELERTVKTAKGWWVLWMKVSAPDKESEELKEAFLVRKSADFVSSGRNKDSSPGRRNDTGSPAGRWLLRDQSRDASGSSARSTGTLGGARGVSEGVGIDARKWVEGLLSLTQ